MEGTRRRGCLTDEVRFIVNMQNRASVALHVSLGFRLARTDAVLPGVRFDGDRGGLFGLHPRHH